MEKASVLDNSASLVMPESRMGMLRNMEQYNIEGTILTLALNNDGGYVVREGEHMSNGFVYDMTTEDGYQKTSGHVRPFDIKSVVGKVSYALETNNLMFTTHRGKELMFRFLISMNGKFQRRK